MLHHFNDAEDVSNDKILNNFDELLLNGKHFAKLFTIIVSMNPRTSMKY